MVKGASPWLPLIGEAMGAQQSLPFQGRWLGVSRDGEVIPPQKGAA